MSLCMGRQTQVSQAPGRADGFLPGQERRQRAIVLCLFVCQWKINQRNFIFCLDNGLFFSFLIIDTEDK